MYGTGRTLPSIDEFLRLAFGDGGRATAEELLARLYRHHRARPSAGAGRGVPVPPGRRNTHWWLRQREAKIDFTGDQFGGPAVLVELAPGREADAARRVGGALRTRMAGPAGNCFDCSVAAGALLAAEGVPTRLCWGTVGPGGRYAEDGVAGVDFKSLAGLLGLLDYPRPRCSLLEEK
jgi:hypothetical protein